jgi:hypothetical protein
VYEKDGGSQIAHKSHVGDEEEAAEEEVVAVGDSIAESLVEVEEGDGSIDV